MLLQLAVCTILSKPFLGMPVRAKGVKWLILQGENSNRRLQADLSALKKWVGEEDWKQIEPKLTIHTLEKPEDADLSLSSDQVSADLTKLIEKEKPDIIAIDPLLAFAVGSLNNDAGMQKTCQKIAKLAGAAGHLASVVILHHTLTGKVGAARATGYDRASYGRGSKALSFWTRGQINVAAAAAETNERLVVSCGKNSNGRDFPPFGVKLNPATLIYEVEPSFDIAGWQEMVDGTPKPKPKFTPESVVEFVAATPLTKKDLVRG
jgi:hypothetical protein